MITSNLREMMQAQGETIQGLSEKTGLAAETIKRARSEKISRCALETLATIAAALGVKVKDLFSEE